MTIVAQGTVNLTALIVPDLIVQILAPDVSQLNGVPTNVLGVVGTATWGPVNSPTLIGSMAAYAAQFGPIQARKYDLGTVLAAAVLQGANNFKCVRVTDNTDVAATIVVQSTCITLTSKFTGSFGNNITVALAAGSAASTFKATVNIPGFAPEVFDNVPGTANAFWVNLANAINLGQSGLRGPSNIIVATPGAGVAAPTLTTLTLASGTDGATTITGSVLLGVDTTPRKGMYALRNSGASIGVLADCDDSTTWTTQVAFGLAEGIYMVMTGPAGDTIANAVSAIATAGIDSYAGKLMFGDWCYFADGVNNVTRLISPQGFVAGLFANMGPQNSSLNKQLQGIVGTQKSFSNQVYAPAELQSLGGARIDVITNPVPGGSYFGCRFGRNTSSSIVIHGDNYSRMTAYLAASLNAGLGSFVGRLQSPSQRREAVAVVSSFLDAMANSAPPMIGNAQGTLPYSVQCDDNNNSAPQVAAGIERMDVRVTYLSIVEFFVVNVVAGQSVVVNRTNTQAAA